MGESYVARIIAALGDTSKWEYYGEFYDREYADGECVCGQQGIRWEFIIVHVETHERAVLGSSCIKHYYMINPIIARRMDDDFKREKSKVDKWKRQIKQIEELSSEYNEEIQKLNLLYPEYKRAFGWESYGTKYLWKILYSNNWKEPSTAYEITSKYKNIEDKIKNLKEKTVFIKRIRQKSSMENMLASI